MDFAVVFAYFPFRILNISLFTTRSKESENNAKSSGLDYFRSLSGKESQLVTEWQANYEQKIELRELSSFRNLRKGRLRLWASCSSTFADSQ